MTYHKLPEVYAWEIASTAVALAGSSSTRWAGRRTRRRRIASRSTASREGVEPKLPEGVKGQVKADRLLYSQAVAIQDAGIQLLEKLQQSAHMEIASGQRTDA